MNKERKKIKLNDNNGNQIFTDLFLCDETDDDMLLLELTIENKQYSFKGYDFFSVLLELRNELEKNNIQIMCNGAAKNVYPSPMQMRMGTGRSAYRLFVGKQAQNIDIVDIFECDENLEFVNVKEQYNYYKQWLNSLMK